MTGWGHLVPTSFERVRVGNSRQDASSDASSPVLMGGRMGLGTKTPHPLLIWLRAECKTRPQWLSFSPLTRAIRQVSCYSLGQDLEPAIVGSFQVTRFSPYVRNYRIRRVQKRHTHPDRRLAAPR